MNHNLKKMIGLLGLAAVFTAGNLNAAVWATIGMNDNGGLGIEFTSTDDPNIVGLTSITILLDGINFFDTDIASPGIQHRVWSLDNTSGPTATLPNSVTTDGDKFATINFGAFTVGNSVNIDFDLDTDPSAVPDNDDTGSPFGAVVVLNFFDSSTVSTVSYGRTIQAGSVTVGTNSYDHLATIPEPGTLMMAGILLGSFGGLHLLKRRKNR